MRSPWDVRRRCWLFTLSHRLSQKALLALQVLGALLIFWILLWPSWVWMHSTMRLIGRAGLDGTILPLGTCLVIFGSVLRNRAGRIWTAPIRWFGRHSYEVYLTHEFLVVFGTELLLKLKRGPLALWFVAILLATAPVGWLVARFYTEPLNRRLRRIQMRAMPKSFIEARGRPVAGQSIRVVQEKAGGEKSQRSISSASVYLTRALVGVVVLSGFIAWTSIFISYRGCYLHSLQSS